MLPCLSLLLTRVPALHPRDVLVVLVQLMSLVWREFELEGMLLRELLLLLRCRILMLLLGVLLLVMMLLLLLRRRRVVVIDRPALRCSWWCRRRILLLLLLCSLRRTTHECRMVRVDVRRLNRDKTARILRSRAQSFTKQVRNNLHERRVQSGEPLELLYLRE